MFTLLKYLRFGDDNSGNLPGNVFNFRDLKSQKKNFLNAFLQNVNFTGNTRIKFSTLHQVKLYQVLKIEFD